MKGESLGQFEEFTLLALAALGEGTYAVPVQEHIEKATGRGVSMGAVYAVLTRLEDKELVRSWMGAPTAERGGKPKRLYRVTPHGLKSVRELHQARTRIWAAIAEGKRP